MYLSLLMSALAFLGALFGGFLASYMKKKGENLATKEDLHELVKQTAALTQAAKEIEARISIGVWTQQQRWDVQKTTLLDSLKELATAETLLHYFVTTFRNTKDHSGDWAEKRSVASEKYADAINSFRRTQLAMEIVCGAVIADRFQVIDNIFGRTLHAARRGDFVQIWGELLPALQAAKLELTKTIRTQLEFDPQQGLAEGMGPKRNERLDTA